MPFRKLPNTDEARVRAITLLLKAFKIFVTGITEEAEKIRAITDLFHTALKTLGERFIAEVEGRGYALTAQSTATQGKEAALSVLRKVCSHFIIVLNLAIDRGKLPVGIRSSFGLDINQEGLPNLDKEADVYDLAVRIIAGETHRIAEGGVPLAWPSLADVQAALDAYEPIREEQIRKKTNFDIEQEDVSKMRAEVDEAIKDGWDQVEFYFRKDEPSSLRRKARAWGVEYATRPGEPPEPVSETIIGKVGPEQKKEIMHNGFDVNTLLIAKNTGSVPVELYTAASPSDVPPGTRVKIDPGVQTEVWISELGADSNTYLMIYNADKSTEGSYEVTVGNPE
jgi:hypothetical protein